MHGSHICADGSISVLTSLAQRAFFFFFVSDRDECLDNRGGCSQLCTNTPGSFSCSCRTGFTLHSNGASCTGNDTESGFVVTATPDVTTKQTCDPQNQCSRVFWRVAIHVECDSVFLQTWMSAPMALSLCLVFLQM